MSLFQFRIVRLQQVRGTHSFRCHNWRYMDCRAENVGLARLVIGEFAFGGYLWFPVHMTHSLMTRSHRKDCALRSQDELSGLCPGCTATVATLAGKATADKTSRQRFVCSI
jgi:hypothetical protein